MIFNLSSRVAGRILVGIVHLLPCRGWHRVLFLPGRGASENSRGEADRP